MSLWKLDIGEQEALDENVVIVVKRINNVAFNVFLKICMIRHTWTHSEKLNMIVNDVWCKPWYEKQNSSQNSRPYIVV